MVFSLPRSLCFLPVINQLIQIDKTLKKIQNNAKLTDTKCTVYFDIQKKFIEEDLEKMKKLAGPTSVYKGGFWGDISLEGTDTEVSDFLKRLKINPDVHIKKSTFVPIINPQKFFPQD